MLSFVGQKRCFQVSLEAHVCQPSQSGQRSRQELRQRHWTSSWRFQSGFSFTFQMGMIELRNSCMNSIILSYICLPCWIRDIGVKVYKSLGSFQGRMRGLRLSSETSSRISFFAEIRVMIELNHISVTNRSYCYTSRKNLVDNASCVWIFVLLQNIDDLIVDMTNCQMFKKVESDLPAKIWRLIGCTEMISW